MSEPSEDPLLPAGSVIGDYELVRVVGAGSFGTVYEGRHPVIAKRVAVKVLARKYSSDPTAEARFVSEARVVNEIRHRNIVDIFSFGALPDGRLYFVMEYLDGPTLQELLRQRGRLSLEEAVPLLREIASALDAAHRTGVAHRDVKPANILVIEEEHGPSAKLIDFGIAKLLAGDGAAHKTQTGALVGTPAYMAPEQCRSKAVDHRSDVYAWGLVAHEMLTGSPPFEGKDSLELMLQHTQAPPPPASHVNPDLPAGVDAPILATLEKDPEKRPELLLSVVEKLESLVDATPRRRARGRLRVALLGLAALPVAVGLALLLRAPAPAPAPPPQLVQDVPAEAAPPPAPIPAPPPQPTMVVIEVVGTPEGTVVTGANGAVLGTAPGSITLPRGVEPLRLGFARDGFVSEELSVMPTSNLTVPVRMTRKREPERKKTPARAVDKEDIELPEL